MVRGRIEKILGSRGYGSRVLGLGFDLGYVCFHHCVLNTPATVEGVLVVQLKLLDSVLACG